MSAICTNHAGFLPHAFSRDDLTESTGDGDAGVYSLRCRYDEQAWISRAHSRHRLAKDGAEIETKSPILFQLGEASLSQAWRVAAFACIAVMSGSTAAFARGWTGFPRALPLAPGVPAARALYDQL